MINVLFRVDDGPGIGAGHLMRCKALAEVLKKSGGRIHLIASAESSLHHEWLADGARIVAHGLPIGGREDLEATLHCADSLVVDWLVADGYAFDETWLGMLACRHRLLYLDDLGMRDAKATLLLNQNAGAEERYRQAYGRVGRALLGVKWFLRRHAWQAAIPCPEPGRLLVTLGGDDRDNLAFAVMRALLSDGRSFHADVVSSAPESGFCLALELAIACPGRFTLYRVPANLVPLMERATVVICGGGVTPLEAASLGVPAVIMALADNQMPGALALASSGAARLVMPGESASSEAVRLALDLIADDSGRSDASAHARRLVDGQGAARVAEVMMEAVR